MNKVCNQGFSMNSSINRPLARHRKQKNYITFLRIAPYKKLSPIIAPQCSYTSFLFNASAPWLILEEEKQKSTLKTSCSSWHNESKLNNKIVMSPIHSMKTWSYFRGFQIHHSLTTRPNVLPYLLKTCRKIHENTSWAKSSVGRAISTIVAPDRSFHNFGALKSLARRSLTT